jgi:hypothetical protein
MMKIATTLNQRLDMPSALAKTPTVIGWYQAEGNVRPRIFAACCYSLRGRNGHG